jgi:hypothetical protein
VTSDSPSPTPDFTFSPYRLGCLGAVIFMPVAADQFGPFAYLVVLLLVVPLLFLEQKPNLLKTFGILAAGAALSLASSLLLGFSDFGRFVLLIGFLVLALFLPKQLS